MNRLYLSIAIFLASVCTAMAIPAKKDTVRIQQPDGSYVNICLHGDEYLHFNTTDDGYSVVKDNRGYYVYAALENGQLVPTAQVAHETGMRTVEEKAYLQKQKKFVAPEMTSLVATKKQTENMHRAQTLAKAPSYNYGNFKGLIILVEYNDQGFSRPDYSNVVDAMVNQTDYTGYDNTSNGQYTGSVRDYFYDNSNGIFSPEFDIVGPIQVNRSKYYAQGTNNAARLIYDVVDAADQSVNFKDYDRDGDGEVDMVYFIFAGLGSNMSGNDSRLIWPHASQIYNPTNYSYVYKDGVRLGRYACSTELYGTSRQNMLDGIGTIVHEFSHVLGLPDLYDTDYEGSGGQSKDPDTWSVMASGSYNNNARTPTGYSIYERYALGFSYPEKIAAEGHLTLESVDSSNKGYRIDTQVNKEFFLLENRQQNSKWDKYLSGHGMLVMRVDSTNASIWNRNEVNCNPNHNYFEIVRAGGKTAPAAADPFPGTRNVRTLNNTTSPANLLTWSGKETFWGLENITENNGVISFDVIDVSILREVSLPESAIVGVGMTYHLEAIRTPDYAPYTFSWTSSDTNIATVSNDGLVTGVAPGTVTITLIANNSLTATCQVTVKQLDAADGIGAFRDLDEGDERMLNLSDAQVLFATNNNNIYVRDASGVLVLSGTDISAKQNDILNGSVYGKFAMVDKIPYLQPVEGYTNGMSIVSTAGSEAVARGVTIDDIADTDYADLITVRGGKFESINNSIYLVGQNKQVRVYNRLGASGFSMPKDYKGKYYDVTGILLTYKENGELIDELAIMRAPVEGPGPIEDVDGIGAFRDLEEGAKRMLNLSNAQVLFAKDDNIYVRDTTGALVLSGTGISAKQNDVLNGAIFGKLAVVGKIPYLQPIEGYTNNTGIVSTAGSEAVAREVDIDNIANTDYADLVTLKGGKFESINNSIYLVGQNKQVRVYNRLGASGFSMPKDYIDKYYDVTGILLTYEENGELIDELSIMRAPTEGGFTAIGDIKTDAYTEIAVYAIDGKLIARTTGEGLRNLTLKPGIYMVKSGNSIWKIIAK